MQEKVETKTTGKANGSAEPKDTFVELTDKTTNVDATNEEHHVDVMELEFAASDTKGNKSNNWTVAIEAAAAATIVSKLDCTVALQSPVDRAVSRSDKHDAVIDLLERTANPMDTDVALKAVRTDTSNQPDMVQQQGGVIVSIGTAAVDVSNAALVQAEFALEGAESERSKPTDARQHTREAGQHITNDNWTSVSSKKRTPNSKKLMQIAKKSPDVPKNSNSFTALSNVNDDDGKLTGENLQLVESYKDQKLDQNSSSTPAALNKALVTVNQNEGTTTYLNMQLLAHDQNEGKVTPTIHFSSPHVEKIIKDSQIKMMLDANPMFKQLLVTLNTSMYDIPSQSCKSIGEHGGESGQPSISTANNKGIIQAKVREMVINSKVWNDLREYDNEEGWGDGIAGFSSEEDDQEDD